MDRSSTVVCAVNAIGRDDRHYTVMMLRNGEVVARRYGSSGQGDLNRLVISRFIHPSIRNERMLRNIAHSKGFVVL